MAQTNFEIEQSLEKVWDAFIDILEEHGTIKNKNKNINRIEFKSNSLMTNFASVTISLKKVSPKKTEVNMNGSSMEGLMKTGYAEKLMDKLSFELSNYFQPEEKKEEYIEDNSNFIWLIIITTILVLLFMFLD